MPRIDKYPSQAVIHSLGGNYEPIMFTLQPSRFTSLSHGLGIYDLSILEGNKLIENFLEALTSAPGMPQMEIKRTVFRDNNVYCIRSVNFRNLTQSDKNYYVNIGIINGSLDVKNYGIEGKIRFADERHLTFSIEEENLLYETLCKVVKDNLYLTKRGLVFF